MKFWKNVLLGTTALIFMVGVSVPNANAAWREEATIKKLKVQTIEGLYKTGMIGSGVTVDGNMQLNFANGTTIVYEGDVAFSGRYKYPPVSLSITSATSAFTIDSTTVGSLFEIDTSAAAVQSAVTSQLGSDGSSGVTVGLFTPTAATDGRIIGIRVVGSGTSKLILYSSGLPITGIRSPNTSGTTNEEMDALGDTIWLQARNASAVSWYIVDSQIYAAAIVTTSSNTYTGENTFSGGVTVSGALITSGGQAISGTKTDSATGTYSGENTFSGGVTMTGSVRVADPMIFTVTVISATTDGATGTTTFEVPASLDSGVVYTIDSSLYDAFNTNSIIATVPLVGVDVRLPAVTGANAGKVFGVQKIGSGTSALVFSTLSTGVTETIGTSGATIYESLDAVGDIMWFRVGPAGSAVSYYFTQGHVQ